MCSKFNFSLISEFFYEHIANETMAGNVCPPLAKDGPCMQLMILDLHHYPKMFPV